MLDTIFWINAIVAVGGIAGLVALHWRPRVRFQSVEWDPIDTDYRLHDYDGVLPG